MESKMGKHWQHTEKNMRNLTILQVLHFLLLSLLHTLFLLLGGSIAASNAIQFPFVLLLKPTLLFRERCVPRFPSKSKDIFHTHTRPIIHRYTNGVTHARKLNAPEKTQHFVWSQGHDMIRRNTRKPHRKREIFMRTTSPHLLDAT